MSTIITRAGKGAPLTYLEADANFNNLNTDKLDKTGGAFSGGTINNCTIGATTASSGKFTTLEASSDVTITGNLTVNGTTTNINTTNLVVEDKNVILGDVTTPSNTTADGGGITLKGASDKTFNWVNSTSAWTSSEHLNLASGKAYYINGTSVLNATTLGSGVTASSLTSVGTLTGLTVTATSSRNNPLTTISSTGASGGATGNDVGLLVDISAYGADTSALHVKSASTSRLWVGNDGNIGIGTITPGTSKVLVAHSALGANAGDQSMALRLNSSSIGNTDYLEISNMRSSAGSSWTSAGYRLQQKVDTTWQAWMQFNNGDGTSANNYGISWGTGNGSTVSPLNVSETMRLDQSGILTLYGGAGGTQLQMRNGGDLVIYNADNTVSASLYCDVNKILYNDQRLVQSALFYRLNGTGPTLVSASATTPIAIFGVGVTLESNTVYEFELWFVAAKTAGTTSHAVRINFAGTLTYNGINWNSISGISALNSFDPTAVMANQASAAITTVSDATIVASISHNVLVKGTFSVSSSGTWIPQFSMSAAPGGNYVIQPGAYVKVTPISASGANTNIGPWA